MTALSDIALPQLSVLDSSMAYREAGPPGDPVALFLHGNPTSSYIWRNIMPLVAPVAHCIAPDLIGFGQSGKPGIGYRFADQVRYLDAFLANAGISSAFVIAHDWGTAHFTWQPAGRSLSVGLLLWSSSGQLPTWEDFHPAGRETFQKFRTPGIGEQMILEDNAFIERVLPGAIIRKLTDEEMAIYRAPFSTPESRVPTWRFPNELPIAGKPADVYSTIEHAHAALSRSSYPKLLFAGDPGVLVSPLFADRFAKKLNNCRVLHIGPGLHYLQEDHPEAIGKATAEWIKDADAIRRN
jgi:haloalkane dehalogenase